MGVFFNDWWTKIILHFGCQSDFDLDTKFIPLMFNLPDILRSPDTATVRGTEYFDKKNNGLWVFSRDNKKTPTVI